MNDSPDEFWIQRSERLTLSGRAEEKGRKCTVDALYVIRLGQGGFHEVSVGVRESPDGTLSGKQQRYRPVKRSAEFLSPRIRSMFVKRCSVFRIDDGNLLTLS